MKRLVIKGFQYKEGIDYIMVFSPVLKLTTTPIVVELVAKEDLHLWQLDVKIVFLNCDLEEKFTCNRQRNLK